MPSKKQEFILLNKELLEKGARVNYPVPLGTFANYQSTHKDYLSKRMD